MRFLRFPELLSLKGISFSREHIRRLELRGEFPRRVRIGAGTVGWVEDEVDAWSKARIAERDAAHSRPEAA